MANFIGYVAWNKGLTKVDPRVLKYALKNKISKLGQKPWNTGKKYPAPWLEEYRFKNGHTSWKKGKVGLYSKEENKKFGNGVRGKLISEAHKLALLQGRIGKPGPMTGKHWSTEQRKKFLDWHSKQPTEWYAKCLRRHPMSSLEIAFEKIVKENNLPYKFVGNGKFWIERKNPDFINTNGQKIVIELFYRRHKEQITGGYEKWRKDRIKVFGKYGWRVIFLEPSDLVNSLQIINGEEAKKNEQTRTTDYSKGLSL